MELNGEKIDSIVITSETTGRVVTADDGHEVIAIISEEAIVAKNGFDVKIVPAGD